jgi:hypothetical protein
MAKLVCVQCQRELYPEKNGFKVVEMASFGPYQVWDSDKWKCPTCGIEVAAGFPIFPYLEHFEEGFQAELERIRDSKRLIDWCYNDGR